MICKTCGGNCKETNGKYVCESCCMEYAKESYANQQSIGSVDGGVSVFDKNINCILEITCTVAEGSKQGSGMLITSDGYAITNAHVVTYNNLPCLDITVKIAGEYVKATVVKLGDGLGGNGSGIDLAILKLATVPFNARVVNLGNFDDVRVGEKVYVIGNARGEGTSITSGIVSDRLRNVNGRMLLMTDCAVNPGNSGGPIFNENGLVIGTIVSKRLDSDGMNYAIPISVVQQFLDSFDKR